MLMPLAAYLGTEECGILDYTLDCGAALPREKRRRVQVGVDRRQSPWGRFVPKHSFPRAVGVQQRCICLSSWEVQKMKGFQDSHGCPV